MEKNLNFAQILHYFEKFKKHIVVKDRRSGISEFFKMYKNCFTGKQATLAIQTLFKLSKEEAKIFGKHFIEEKLIVHVTHAVEELIGKKK
jgi:hypothetical protein